MDLLTELNRAMEYIEANLSDEEALTAVAGVTSYSPYHFQRIFNYIADMPLSEYIRRRKMSLAAMELQSESVKIIDLAVKYGYDSADSFSRAFHKQHGLTPSAARRSGAQFEIYPPLTFQITIKGVQKMNWRIEEKEAFEVFGIERVFANDGTNQVPDFWSECHRNGAYERLFDDAGGRRDPDGHGYPREDGACVIHAICGYADLGKGHFPYMICANVNDGAKTHGYQVVNVPKNTWAILKSDESETIGKEIPKLFGRAYSEWLPASGYERAAGPDMEIYGVAVSGKYYEEVWIPVKKKA